MTSELIVERRTPLPVSPEDAFAWHVRPGAFERLVPPWKRIEVLERSGGIQNGSRVRLRVHAGPAAFAWTAEYREVEPGRGFTDIQVDGPFDRWVHTRRFESGPEGSAVLHDRIACELPLGVRVGRECVARDLHRLLAYRHALTALDLAMHSRAAARPRMHVALTGASGLIGSMLVPALTTGGHRVTRIVRGAAGPGEIRWDPAGDGLDPGALRGIDAVVHLAGENIAGGRWTVASKSRMLESRRTGTRLLAEAVARAPDGPRILVSASAIGFYGERGEETLTEASGAGTGFLPEVATLWEAGTRVAEAAGVRVVRLRIGLVLTPRGGLLERMLPVFRLGLGGRLGSGEQWMSWISADDLVGAFHHALTEEGLAGPVNAVAPGAVRNTEFTWAVGQALGRPTPFPVPSAALRLLFGEMADGALLASARVLPDALIRSGYRFRHPTLAEALGHVLGRTGGSA
jgi:uncharacterized protein (TIGR01777 family)